MVAVVDIQISGLIEVRAALDKKIAALHGAPMLGAMRDASMYVMADARKLAPVDTGRLRASILPDVRLSGSEIIGVVGSNVVYAPFVELGTRPHWPPPGALATWARRHGMSEFVVMRAIAMRGTKARRFLQGGFEANKQRIITRIERGISEAVKA